MCKKSSNFAAVNMRYCAHNILKCVFRSLILVVLLLLCGCRAAKYVPEDEYLLNKAKVVVTDTHEESTTDLAKYLQQKQNSEILGFWKLQLHIYNTAPADTTTKSKKRLAENAHKMGEAPVVYSPLLTGASIQQLNKAMINRGYFNATVDTQTVLKKNQKLNITYYVTANQPYHIREYTVNLQQEDLLGFATDKNCLVKEGNIFNTEILDNERQRITSAMRRDGYFYFDKSMLDYLADSSYNAHEVAVELKMNKHTLDWPDSIRNKVYTRYRISRVFFHQDYDPEHMPVNTTLVTRGANDYIYSYIDKPLLRNNVLRRTCKIRPGDYYDESVVERSYALLNTLAPIKYVEIRFEPAGEDKLECHVTVSRTKLNSVSAEIEGTYSAGDWGIAVGAGYINRNIFRGAEQLSLNGRFSYEWRQNGGRAIEAKGEAGLLFPNSLNLKLAFQYQNRPDEFIRDIASAGLYYTIRRNPNSHWRHVFNLIDISYVYLPWKSKEFQEKIINKSSLLKYSYTDHFIMDWSYMGVYTSRLQLRPNHNYIRFQYLIETAGNFLYAVSKVASLEQNEAGSYVLWNIPFSQYAKADVNFTFHQVLVPNHRLVYHIGVGAVVPYLNATSVPFEKRYFSGGSNSVRGWQARTLGPGGFKGAGGGLVYDMQAGDIRLDLNLEYRWKVWNFIELAAFTDAGNIWTIRDYTGQEHGTFHFDEFYKQIAWSYGVGLRLDFSILLFRVDFGVKLYDPTRLYEDNGSKVWRTARNGLSWHDDMTFHFAIGYPF